MKVASTILAGCLSVAALLLTTASYAAKVCKPIPPSAANDVAVGPGGICPPQYVLVTDEDRPCPDLIDAPQTSSLDGNKAPPAHPHC
jgi:hypothetical protein